MEAHEYVYRMKPLVVPGLAFLILYPIIVGGIAYFFSLNLNYLIALLGIYAVAAIILFCIWISAKNQKVLVDEKSIILRSLTGKKTIEPKDIRKISFVWTKRNNEIVLLKTGKKVYYLSDLYFPFNELLTDLEEFIVSHHVRSNLASHYGMN